jgi:small ligand-binding sensory domain FIST
MKSLIVILTVAAVTGFTGLGWINSEINKRVQASEPEHNSTLTVQHNSGMQTFGYHVEDDYTASDALIKTGYYNPQTTQHYYFIQDASNDAQPARVQLQSASYDIN